MEYYKLAKVLKPQGLKGELKLQPYTDDHERFYDLSHIYIKKGGAYEPHDIQSARLYKQFAYLKITGIDSCEDAEALRGHFLYIDRESAQKPEDSYFIADLIGMSVKAEDGSVYGTVKDVFNTGAADIYIISGTASFMFPAAPGVISDIDEKNRIITVNSTKLKEVAVYD